jgi:recombination protein RecR
MSVFAGPLSRLIDELKRLPGIGQKGAQRIAFHIERSTRGDAERLARAILEVKEKIRLCSVCNNLTEKDPCEYCADPNRDRSLICVVETPYNVVGVERLIERLKDGTVREIIVATNPNVEGEATAIYLSKLIKPLGVKVSRIAMGIPVGSELEFADEVTMVKAMEGRREI